MFDRLCKIIFIRHGATSYSEEKRLYDSEDYPPLNELGKEETQKITHWLKETCPNVDIIYTSSALRSIQSARIIAKNYKMDFEILDNLQERKAGIWGGLTFAQIQEKYPDMFIEYKKNPSEFIIEGAESPSEINERVSKIIEKIIKTNAYKTVVVVTHAGVIQSAISSALQVSVNNQDKIYIPTGSASQISYFNNWASLLYSGYVPL